MQQEECNLDSVFQATESFENSYLSPPAHKYPFRDRSRADNTSFMFVIPTERATANPFSFDGIQNKTEVVTLNASPKHAGAEDTYYILNRHNNLPNGPQGLKKNESQPILCLTSDTFWLFSYNRPARYETTSTWNDVFQSNYPQLYAQMTADAQARSII